MSAVRSVVETTALVVAGPMVAVAVAAHASDVGLLRRVLPYWYLVSFAVLTAAAVVARTWEILASAALMAVVVLVTIRGDQSREWLHWLRVLLLLAMVVLLASGVA